MVFNMVGIFWLLSPLQSLINKPLIKECNKSKSWIPIKQKQFEKSSDIYYLRHKERKRIKKNRNQNVGIAKNKISPKTILSFCRHWIHASPSTCVRQCNVKKYISYWMFHDFIVLYVVLYRIALCSTFSLYFMYARKRCTLYIARAHTHLTSTIKIYLRSNCVDSVYVCINTVSMLCSIQSVSQPASKQTTK